jgi:hypothetical protein
MISFVAGACNSPLAVLFANNVEKIMNRSKAFDYSYVTYSSIGRHSG